ncbi:MAG TPA: chemotaxis protein CheX [Polyangiaceae bacterium]|nr:chemotaxis protein CheX [Polyangiaceae bacterium]
MTPVLLSACLEALSDSAREVAATVLGGVAFDALNQDSSYGSGHGAYLGLVADDEPIQVGLLVEPAGCQVLSKALLGMEPGDEDLPPSDVSDAMCEIVNIVVGGLKRRVAERLRITLGLPLFVAGHPLPNQGQEVSARGIQLGAVSVKLLVLTQKPHAVPISRSGVTIQTAGTRPAKEESA